MFRKIPTTLVFVLWVVPGLLNEIVYPLWSVAYLLILGWLFEFNFVLKDLMSQSTWRVLCGVSGLALLIAVFLVLPAISLQQDPVQDVYGRWPWLTYLFAFEMAAMFLNMLIASRVSTIFARRTEHKFAAFQPFRLLGFLLFPLGVWWLHPQLRKAAERDIARAT